MVFHASTVDSNTVSVADDGSDVDMAAFPSDSLMAIAAKNGGIELTFNETGKLNPYSSSQNTAGAAGNDETNALENTLVIAAAGNILNNAWNGFAITEPTTGIIATKFKTPSAHFCLKKEITAFTASAGSKNTPTTLKTFCSLSKAPSVISSLF